MKRLISAASSRITTSFEGHEQQLNSLERSWNLEPLSTHVHQDPDESGHRHPT